MFLFLRQAYPAVEAQGSCDLVGEKFAHPLIRGAMDDLAHRPGHGERRLAFRRLTPAPEIDQGLAFNNDGAAGADFAAGLKVRDEGVEDAGEFRIADAFDLACFRSD